MKKPNAYSPFSRAITRARAVTRAATRAAMVCAILAMGPAHAAAPDPPSIARHWNETLLAAIRLDSARPTVHARNLFHLSAVMWDAWSAYHPQSKPVFYQQRVAESAQSVGPADEAAAISYAAFTLLDQRFKTSLNYPKISLALSQALEQAAQQHGFALDATQTPAILGTDVAAAVIAQGLQDGANEAGDYQSRHYQPLNAPLNPHQRGNPNLMHPDRWQALELPDFVGQSGISAATYPPFVGPEWGAVRPFSLTQQDAVLKSRDAQRYPVYLDAGPPPSLAGTAQQRLRYQQGFKQVLEYSNKLDANSAQRLNISPSVRGNSSLGSNAGPGHALNPVTQRPYADVWVLAADYYRALAEFWADGPDSETPPGHWFVMFNLVSDQPSIAAGFGQVHRANHRLEWDLQGYLALGGAMHDAAIAAWSHKGFYDFVRPISAIRHLCDLGQSSDPELPNYHPAGMPLQRGLIELMDVESTQPGSRHHHLALENNQHLGQIAVNTWRGPAHIENRRQDVAGVGWIHCGDWWPYQRPNFVTPPFAGYVSGHSTFSRAAAEVLTLLTGSAYFPGGLGRFNIKQNKFLVFEKGPKQDISLQWATYQDAADDCSLSRIYGGIHPTDDDIPGRFIGYTVGHRAFAKAQSYFASSKKQQRK